MCKAYFRSKNGTNKGRLSCMFYVQFRNYLDACPLLLKGNLLRQIACNLFSDCIVESQTEGSGLKYFFVIGDL